MKIFLPILVFCLFFADLFPLETDYTEIVETHYSVSIQNGAPSKDTITVSYRNLFDFTGNKVEDIKYDNLGEIIKRYVYIYDDSDRRVGQNQFNSEGRLVREIFYVYDSMGRLIEDNSYDSLGNHEKKFTYHYDASGNLVEDNSYSSSGKLLKKYIHYYDVEGSEIKKEIFNSDILDMSVEYSYMSVDENKVLVEERFYTPDGDLFQIISNEYEYERNGRWVTKTIFIDDVMVEIIEREYF